MRLLFALFCSSCILGSLAVDVYPSWVYDAFDEWAIQWDKYFATPAEREFRVGVFYNKLLHIEEVNARQDSYRLGLNGFSHLTTEEFLEKQTGLLPREHNKDEVVVSKRAASDVPDQVDWVTAGAVTGVKNQGDCGSCWAFSTTGGLEGLNVIFGGNELESFSEEQLVQCSFKYFNLGCNGGEPYRAFEYTAANGIELEDAYPYTSGGGVTGDCQYDASKVVFRNTGQQKVASGSSSALIDAIYTQPVSISIDAEAIESYTSGIFNDPNCGDELDHAILAVGYDLTEEYFLVKNSWGTTWGEDGYIRFAIVGDEEGMCGMYLDNAYPTLD